MTKFEKVAKKAELLGVAYNAILDRDKWENMSEPWADNLELNPERAEMHEYYMQIAAAIESLLDK